MSLVFIIDPNTGEILQETYAEASYRSPLGITVKPRTKMEEMRLRKISENAKKVRLLKEEIARLDRIQELDALEEAQRRRRQLAQEVQEKENFAHACDTVLHLRERMAQLENIILSDPTAESGETQISLDEFTAGGFSALEKRLDAVSAGFETEDQVKQVMQQLLALEAELEALPEQAKQGYFRYLVRLELAQSVIDRLCAAGWSVALEEEGDGRTATRITAENFLGDRAAILFGCDDQITLETPGFTEGTRSALQQLVLGSLREAGASGAVGRCTSHPEPPQTAVCDTSAAAEGEKERIFQ